MHADDLRCKRKLLLGNVKFLSHHAHSLRRAFACNQFAQQARRADARERAPRQFQPGCRAHRPKRRNLHSAFAAAFFLQRIARNGRAFICGNGSLPAEAHLCAGAPKAAVLFQNNGYRIRTGSAAGFRRDDLFHGEKQPELVCNVRKKRRLVRVKAYHSPAPQSRITGLCCRSNSSVVLRICPGYTS